MSTIYDLAKECNLAPSTISKVLNNYSGVSKKTRDFVMAKVKETGYIPNMLARSLLGNKSKNIGILIYINDFYPSLKHHFFTSIIDPFKEVIEKHNYDITLISKNLEHVNGKFLNHCISKNMDGILCFGDTSNEGVQELMNSDIPIVAFDYIGRNCSGITCETEQSFYDLTKYLIDLNHKNIKCILGDDSKITQKRMKAFTCAMQEHGIKIDESNFIHSVYCDHNTNYNITKEIMTGSNPPTAIMFPDDLAAYAGYSACYDLGLNVPDDISITGYDGIELSDFIRPKLTTVKQDVTLIANELASKLLDIIDNGKVTNQTIVLPTKLKIEGSCKMLNK